MECIQSKKSGTIRHLIALWNIAYDGVRRYNLIKNALWLVYAISDFLTILLLQRVFESFENVGQNGRGFGLAVLLFSAILLFNEFMLAVTNVVTEDSCYLMMKNLGQELHKKVDEMDTIKFEQVEYLNNIQQAKSGIESGTFLLNVLSMVGFYHIPYLIFVGAYLFNNQPVLILMLFLIAVPIMVNQWIKMKEYEKVVDDSAALEREYTYYKKCIQDVEYFKETRLLQAFSYFHKLYRETVQAFNCLKLKTARKMCRMGMMMQLISLVAYLGTIVLMIVLVCRGNIKMSVFFAIFTSFSSVFSLMENLIGYYIGQISEKSGSVNHLMDFLLEQEQSDPTGSLEEEITSISLEGVTFSYPNTNTPILNNINCVFHGNETIAIVGENGAGKSTLVKLLASIYEPQQGRICYNGKNIVNFSKKSIWKKISVVFQTFQKYKMTLWDNLFPGKTERWRKLNII